MPTATEHQTALGRIAALVAQARAQPDVPSSLAPILAEIARLSAQSTGDTPEASDVPSTENQSL